MPLSLPLPPAAPSASALAAAPPAVGQHTPPGEAGVQFEAMMLERLLASARPPAPGPEGDWRAMADRSVAGSLARQSPLGLAALIERSAK